MRCQKVRSYLPAYCREELAGREVLTVREHLATCASCRNEEVALRALNSSARELPRTTISTDFNTRLLNRIAQERFAETRTRAYFPKPAPRLLWGRAVPAVAGVLALLIVAIGALAPQQDGFISFHSGSASLDNSYLTVQPDENPNMAVDLRNWSLKTQLAKHERMNRITGMLTGSDGFTNVYSHAGMNWDNTARVSRQYNLLERRPVIRVLQPATSTLVTEERTIY